ncbi:hypothetical protein PIB30_054465, partial [Stylosanthes scabra]|nr:hypothetical protein [Stylosanthes scabra]
MRSSRHPLRAYPTCNSWCHRWYSLEDWRLKWVTKVENNDRLVLEYSMARRKSRVYIELGVQGFLRRKNGLTQKGVNRADSLGLFGSGKRVFKGIESTITKYESIRTCSKTKACHLKSIRDWWNRLDYRGIWKMMFNLIRVESNRFFLFGIDSTSLQIGFKDVVEKFT